MFVAATAARSSCRAFLTGAAAAGRSPSPSPRSAFVALASTATVSKVSSPHHLFSSVIAPQPAASKTVNVPSAAASVFMSMTPDVPPAGYRPNVGICLVNSDGLVFVARRVDLPDSWQMPQGGVDENEEPRAAAFRELREETGVTSVDLIGEVPEWLTYDFPPEVKEKIKHLWGKEWKGQAQKWFLFKFTGDESEINVNGDGSERPEFSEWKWAPTEEVLERAVDFKRPVYEKAFDSFGSLLS